MTEKPAKTILVVDDEHDLVEYLTSVLEDNGFHVAAAVNGKDGMEKAVAILPDLILLDVSMPEQSGVRMYRNLQEDARTSAIPVVMLTGVSHEFKRFIETRKRVRPPAGYFDKPPDREQLLAKIRELLAIAD
jgi:DNA-binding response OmpR family regulator